MTNRSFAWMLIDSNSPRSSTSKRCATNVGATRTWPAETTTLSSPTVNNAAPRRTMNVSEYGCRCSRGPDPTWSVYSWMIET